jgi:hypothetical protein
MVTTYEVPVATEVLDDIKPPAPPPPPGISGALI